MPFSPEKFGNILDRLRLARGYTAVESLAEATGIATHTLRRYFRGLNDKPSYPDIIELGKVLDINPLQMAALAELWVLEGTEALTFSSEEQACVQRVQSFLVELEEPYRSQFVALIELAIIVQRHRVQDGEAPDLLTTLLRSK